MLVNDKLRTKFSRWCDIIVLCKYELPCVCVWHVWYPVSCGMCVWHHSYVWYVLVCACVWHHSRQKARRGCCRATDHFLNAFRVYFGSCTHKCKGASQCCTHKCPLHPQVQGCSRGELSWANFLNLFLSIHHDKPLLGKTTGHSSTISIFRECACFFGCHIACNTY